MADVQTDDLYHQDFHQWALDQARAVRGLRDAAARQGNNLPALDWDNLIEELEGLATGVRSELRNRMITIIQHLVKLELSPASDPRRGWEETVRRSRFDVELLLEDNPSVRREITAIVQAPVMAKAAAMIVDDLMRRGEMSRGTQAPAYTEAQIFEDWWPSQWEETHP